MRPQAPVHIAINILSNLWRYFVKLFSIKLAPCSVVRPTAHSISILCSICDISHLELILSCASNRFLPLLSVMTINFLSCIFVGNQKGLLVYYVLFVIYHI